MKRITMPDNTAKVLADTKKFEGAWSRYIDRLAKGRDAETAPDGRTRWAARKAVRAARRNLNAVCEEIGVEVPAP